MPGSWSDALLGASGHPGHSPVLRLFEGPVVRVQHGDVEVPEGSKRLLVFVALRRGRVDRRHAAGSLWPFGGDDRAAGNLRSALWRLKRAGIDVMCADKHSLWIHGDASVDVDVVDGWACRLLNGQQTPADLAVSFAGLDCLDLLPGWYDDWVLIERERVRQRLLHAMEALCRCLVREGRLGEAVDVALNVVSAEPLRESGHRVLLEAHLAEGNRDEARRSFNAYRALLARELGIEAEDGLFEALTGKALPAAPVVQTDGRRTFPGRGFGLAAQSAF